MIEDTPLWDESVNETVRDGVGPLVPLFELLTHLGDGALLLVTGVLIYWFGGRRSPRERAFVIAVGTAALALSAGMTGVIQIPRPTLAFAAVDYPGYTFPSAHAMGSAAFYGAIAVTMKRGRLGWRLAGAAVLVAIIALSRVVIGVHYPGDVLVGAVLGFGLVGIGLWVRQEGLFDPGAMFALATVISLVAVALGSRVFVSLTIGASAGGMVGWHLVRGRTTTTSGAAILVVGGIGLLGLVTLRTISSVVGAPGVGSPPSELLFIGEVLGYAILTALVLLAPAIAVRVEDHAMVRSIQQTLPFRGRIVEPAGFELETDD